MLAQTLRRLVRFAAHLADQRRQIGVHGSAMLAERIARGENFVAHRARIGAGLVVDLAHVQLVLDAEASKTEGAEMYITTPFRNYVHHIYITLTGSFGCTSCSAFAGAFSRAAGVRSSSSRPDCSRRTTSAWCGAQRRRAGSSRAWCPILPFVR